MFPFGCGDFTMKGREVTISDQEAIEFYEQFADLNPVDGSITYRFASHRIWSFWAMNRYRRHKLLQETNYYMSTHPYAKNISYEELRDQVKNKGGNSYIEQGINLAISKIPGTNPAWWQETLDLSAMCLNLDAPLVFYTVTFAELHDPNFHRLLCMLKPDGQKTEGEVVDYKARKRMLNKNLHIGAWYFAQRFSSFTKHLRNIFDGSWYWQRQEMAGRLIAHGHGIFGSHRNKELVEKAAIALLGFLAQKCIQALNDEQQVDKEQFLEDETHENFAHSRKNLFSRQVLDSAFDLAQPHIESMKTSYQTDQESNLQRKNSYYIGVSAQKRDQKCSK